MLVRSEVSKYSMRSSNFGEKGILVRSEMDYGKKFRF